MQVLLSDTEPESDAAASPTAKTQVLEERGQQLAIDITQHSKRRATTEFELRERDVRVRETALEAQNKEMVGHVDLLVQQVKKVKEWEERVKGREEMVQATKVEGLCLIHVAETEASLREECQVLA
jgi:hypothetical protein